jgi:hypothetical protein
LGAFAESGLLALPPILQGITTALTASWPFLGPKDNKQRHCDVALRGLFTNILSELRFYQRGQGADWQARLQQWEKAPQQQILQRALAVAELLTRVLQAAQAQGQLVALRSVLYALPVAPIEPPSAAAEASGHLPPDAAAVDDSADIYEGKADPEMASSARLEPMSSAAALLALPVAPPLALLMRKLDAFNRLVGLGKFRQAIIVYKDIEASLQAFDPRHYLPTLFSEFSKNVFVHADKLEKGLATKEDFAGNALALLYRIDLDLFIQAKG